jgi:DNA topoisomerase-1
MATVAFAELPAPASDRDAKRAVNQVLGVVSSHLGNTPAVCRASYIHPDVITAFADGTLAERWEGATARGSRLLVPEERKLLQLLRPRRARRVKPAAAA